MDIPIACYSISCARAKIMPVQMSCPEEHLKNIQTFYSMYSTYICIFESCGQDILCIFQMFILYMYWKALVALLKQCYPKNLRDSIGIYKQLYAIHLNLNQWFCISLYICTPITCLCTNGVFYISVLMASAIRVDSEYKYGYNISNEIWWILVQNVLYILHCIGRHTMQRKYHLISITFCPEFIWIVVRNIPYINCYRPNTIKTSD